MKCLLLVTVGSLALVTQASAQSIVIDGGSYDLATSANAGSQSASNSAGGSGIFDTYYVDAPSSASDFDVNLGPVSATALASASWENLIASGMQTVKADLFGYVDAYDELGQWSANASASSRLEFQFHVVSNVGASIFFNDSSSAGLTSQLKRWNGSSYVTFLDSADGDWTGTLTVGDYKWFASDSESVTANGGVAYYHALRIETVPEPATMVALGAGALAFIRRRRQA